MQRKSAFTIAGYLLLGLVLHLAGCSSSDNDSNSTNPRVQWGECPDIEPTGYFYGRECYEELETEWGDGVQYFNPSQAAQDLGTPKRAWTYPV